MYLVEYFIILNASKSNFNVKQCKLNCPIDHNFMQYDIDTVICVTIKSLFAFMMQSLDNN